MSEQVPFDLDLMLLELKSCRSVIDSWIETVESGSIPGVNNYVSEASYEKFWTRMVREILFSSGKLENLVNNIAMDINRS